MRRGHVFGLSVLLGCGAATKGLDHPRGSSAQARAVAPSLAELLDRCAVDYPPLASNRCAAPKALIASAPLDIASATPTLDARCEAGDEVECAWVAWTLEASAHDPAARATASDRLRAAGAGAFDLGACEGRATRECQGITSGASCCDRGLLGCELGCEDACRDARAVARNHTLGVLEPACTAGRALACHVAGMMYAFGASAGGVGVIVEQDSALALARFARGCDLGLGMACHAQGMMLESTADVSVSSRVDALDRRACDLGAGAGCRELASRHDGASSAALYRRACDLGMPMVCKDLASK